MFSKCKPSKPRRPRRSSLVARLLSLILLFALCGLMTGCDTSPSQRVAAVKNLMNQAVAVNQLVDVSIGDIEKVVQDSQLLLQDPNVPEESKPALQKVLGEASARLAKLKLEKQKVMSAIVSYQAILNGADVNNLGLAQEIQLYAVGAGQLGATLPSKYSGYIYLGSALATILAGLIASILKTISQQKQLNQGKAVLTDVVTSVDELLKSPVISNIEAAKQVLSDNQTGATQDVVDAIHDPLQNTGPI